MSNEMQRRRSKLGGCPSYRSGRDLAIQRHLEGSTYQLDPKQPIQVQLFAGGILFEVSLIFLILGIDFSATFDTIRVKQQKGGAKDGKDGLHHGSEAAQERTQGVKGRGSETGN